MMCCIDIIDYRKLSSTTIMTELREIKQGKHYRYLAAFQQNKLFWF